MDRVAQSLLNSFYRLYGHAKERNEIVESVFFDGQVTAKEPSHTLNEYLSPTFFKHFTLEAYEEGYDSGAEKVDGDIYPSFFIIKALLKSHE